MPARVPTAEWTSWLTADVVVVGGGAAGLYAALRAAEAGAGVARSRASRCPRAPATGRRAGWRRRWRPTTPRHATRTTPGRGPRPVPGGGGRDAHPRGAGGRRGAAPARGRGSTPSRAAVSRSPSRAVTPRAGSCTPAGPRPVARSPAAWRGRSPPRGASPCSRRAPPWRCGATARRCAGVVTDAGPIAARATVLATGGGAALWERTTNPWGAIGAGAVLAHAAGADPGRPRVLPVPPHRPGAPRIRVRRGPLDRGAARRGG